MHPRPPSHNKKNPGSFEKNPSWNTQPISNGLPNTNTSFSKDPGSFSSIIKDGFALGIGSSLSNRLVDSIFGPRKIDIAVVPAESVPLCKPEFETYQKCFQRPLESFQQPSGFNDCQSYHDILLKCLNDRSR